MERLPNGKTRNWTPNKNSRICSMHFIDGKNSLPTKNLGEAGKYTKPTTARKPPPDRKLHPVTSTSSVTEDISSNPGESTNTDWTSNVSADTQEHSYAKRCSCECHHNCPQSCECKCHIASACTCCTKVEVPRVEDVVEQKEFAELEIKLGDEMDVSSTKSKMEIMSFISTDNRVKLYTGLKSKTCFDDLHQHAVAQGADRMRYWRGAKRSQPTTREFKATPKKSGPKRKLSTEEELLLSLMKLRLALINEVIADMFGVSDTIVSQVFNTWIKFLSTELSPLIFWPKKDDVFSNFPKSLPHKYRHLRCTIDCTEIFIEKPRNLELQSMTWSDYKKHNTVKFLVAISPNGSICFLSKGWCGRASDRKITLESGFMDLIEPQDVVLADRGFPILEDLAMKSATLEIPPPSSGIEQQERSQVLKTSSVANARIHVERSIGRLKEFSILSNLLPISLVPLVDDIVVVCAALSNLQDPLVVYRD